MEPLLVMKPAPRRIRPTLMNGPAVSVKPLSLDVQAHRSPAAINRAQSKSRLRAARQCDKKISFQFTDIGTPAQFLLSLLRCAHMEIKGEHKQCRSMKC
jgi:hypothetical protein